LGKYFLASQNLTEGALVELSQKVPAKIFDQLCGYPTTQWKICGGQFFQSEYLSTLNTLAVNFGTCGVNQTSRSQAIAF
jgi:hypothetical protein